jgi:hypothetical protein
VKTCKDMVEEFHRLNNAVINGANNGPEVAVLRTRLMIEEFTETYIALHQNDILEAADGLTDLLYVIYGTAVAYGVPCPDTFFTPTKLPVSSFKPGNVLTFGRSVLPLLRRACDAVVMAPAHCGAALLDLAAEVCIFGADCGFPIRELFLEVQRSNLTKTFAPNTTGGKYSHANPKGPGYSPPNIEGVLCRATAVYTRPEGA